MADFNLSDDPLDGVFWESVMSDPPLLDAITGLRDALTAPPSEALRSIQIAAAADAALAAPTVAATTSTDTIVRTSFWARRTAVVSSLATGMFFKLAVGAMAMTTASAGIAAAAGVLPDPLQAATADTLEFIGLEIPHPDDDNDTAPGQTGDSPSDTAPGQTGDSPSDTAPGQTGDSPSDTAPGQTGDSPSDTAPGQTGDSPSDTAPGQTGDSPSDTAPGQTGDSPSDTAPGQTGDSPSDTAPAETGGNDGNGGNGNGGNNGNGNGGNNGNG